MAVTEYTAYFDESRIDPQNRFHVVAGFVADGEVWIKFESELQNQLSKSKKQSGPKKFLQQNHLFFSEMVRNFDLQPIHCVLEKSVMDAVYDQDNRKTPLFYSAYTTSGFACCELLDNYAKKQQIPGPIKVIFDKGTEGAALLDRGYRKYYADKNPTCLKPSIAFDDDEQAMSLLAAHLYAWLLSKGMNQEMELVQFLGINHSLLTIHARAPCTAVVTMELVMRMVGL